MKSNLLFDAFGVMVFYKCLAGFLLVVLLAEFAWIYRCGRRLATSGLAGELYVDLLLDHEWLVDMALKTGAALMLVIVFLASVAVPHSVSFWLLWPNEICGSVVLLLLCVIRFRFTGKAFPLLHRKLVYPVGVLLLISIATGVPMLYSLPLYP